MGINIPPERILATQDGLGAREQKRKARRLELAQVLTRLIYDEQRMPSVRIVAIQLNLREGSVIERMTANYDLLVMLGITHILRKRRRRES